MVGENTTVDITQNNVYQNVSHHYRRMDVCDLGQVISELQSNGDYAKTAYLHIYCDSLSLKITGDVQRFDLSTLKTPLQYIHICSREIAFNVTTVSEVVFATKADLELEIFAQRVPDGTKITFEQLSSQKKATAELYQGATKCLVENCKNFHFSFAQAAPGVSLEFLGGQLSGSDVAIPAAETGVKSFVDMEVFGDERISRTTNLPFLLDREFNLASRELLARSSNLENIISRLSFVVRCTTQSISKLDLSNDCQTLLKRLQSASVVKANVGSERPVYYAPHLSVDTYVEELNTLIVDARELDKQLQRLVWDEAKSAELKGYFSTVIEQMSKTVAGYGNPEDSRREAENAIFNLAENTSEMSKLYDSTKTNQLKFENGVRGYISKKDDEAKTKLIMLGISIGFKIIGVISSYGASGPATAADIANAVNGISAEMSTGSKLWASLKKIAQIAAEVLPQLQAIYAKQTIISSFGSSAATNAEDRAKNAVGKLQTLTTNLDRSSTPDFEYSVNLWGTLAKWDVFVEEVDSTFKLLEADYGVGQVDGMEDYRVSLRKLAVYGKTNIHLLQRVQESVQRFSRDFTEAKARTELQKNLLDVSKRIESKTSDGKDITTTIRVNGEQRLKSLCRSIFLQMEESLLAFIYTFNVSGYPVEFCNSSSKADGLAADLKPDRYDDLRNMLVRRVSEEKNRLPSVQNGLRVEFSTKVHGDTAVFDDFWQQIVQDIGVIKFKIPSDLKETKNWAYLRVTDVNVVFIEQGPLGIETAAREVERDCTVTLGPSVSDHNRFQEKVDYCISPRMIRKIAHSKASWVNPNSQYNLPPLSGEGSICLDLDEPDAREQLKAISDIKIVFDCQGLWVGQVRLRL